MKTKELDVGRITGLSSYELAVKHGFEGTEEEFVEKENAVYEAMQKCFLDGKTELQRIVSSVTDKQTEYDLSEVIESRGDYASLGERLVANDKVMASILARLESYTGENGGDIIEGATVTDEGELIVKLKDSFDDSIYGNIELRKAGAKIQWRSNGFRDWQPLVYLKELMPKIADIIIETLEPEEEATAGVEGVGDEYILTLGIPRGKDGVNGGQILDAEVNDSGELILTVANNDFVLADSDTIVAGMPIIKAGTVEMVECTEKPSMTITGTPTNPIMNLKIPKLPMPKLTRAKVNENGFLEFEYDQEVE